MSILITIQRAPDAPFELVDESTLVKTEGGHENDNEIVHWVEYRLPDSHAIVHRSASVHLKQGLFAAGIAADFG